MPQPQLGWVWLSQSERRAAEDSLADAGPEGTRDELGFGVVHFAYADRFFPGTSVQHTRLRYIWFICWALQELAKRAPGGAFPRAALSEIEDRTGHKLMERYGRGDGTGIIGGRVLRVGNSPVTKPSAVYWNALRTWRLLAPLERTGAAPHRSEIAQYWDVLTDRSRPEVDAATEARAIFANPPPIPAGWAKKSVAIGFDLEDDTREDERLRTGWAQFRDAEGQPSLLSRLAERRAPAPRSMTDPAVRKLCTPSEAASLTRASQAGSLVCIARALYIAMVGDLKREDGAAVESPDAMLAAAIDVYGQKALGLDLDLLAVDVPALGELQRLLDAVQNWVAKAGADYRPLQPLFLAREYALKDDRALLLKGAENRRRGWEPSDPYPLSYRWEKVAGFLDELAPPA